MCTRVRHNHLCLQHHIMLQNVSTKFNDSVLMLERFGINRIWSVDNSVPFFWTVWALKKSRDDVRSRATKVIVQGRWGSYIFFQCSFQGKKKAECNNKLNSSAWGELISERGRWLLFDTSLQVRQQLYWGPSNLFFWGGLLLAAPACSLSSYSSKLIKWVDIIFKFFASSCTKPKTIMQQVKLPFSKYCIHFTWWMVSKETT